MNVFVSALGGNEHSVFSMIQHPVPYDFVLPTHPEMEIVEGVPIIPFSVIEAKLYNSLLQTILALRIIKAFHQDSRVLHVISPPPIPSETQIRNNQEGFAQEIARYGISRPSLRLKWYLASVSIIAKAAKGIGVDILMPPDKSTDDNGFLLEDYWFAATHANVAYGKLVIDQIDEYYLKRGNQ